MEDIERDLVNRQVDEATIKRQQELITRLLEAKMPNASEGKGRAHLQNRRRRPQSNPSGSDRIPQAEDERIDCYAQSLLNYFPITATASTIISILWTWIMRALNPI